MTSPCKRCNEWTPEKGCKHFMPDSETILIMAGYKIYKPGINTRQKKFIVVRGIDQHRFETLAKAAQVLIHNNQ